MRRVQDRARARQQKIAERLSAATEELASGVAQAAAAAEELRPSLEQIASGAEEAAGAANESLAATTQLFHALAEGSENVPERASESLPCVEGSRWQTLLHSLPPDQTNGLGTKTTKHTLFS